MEAPPASVSLRDEKWVCLGKQNGLKTEKKTPQICDERLGCGAAFLSQVCRLIYTNFTVNSSKVVPCLAAFACLQSKGWSSYCVKAVLSITISVNDCKQSLKREISGVFLCILQRGQICGLFLVPDWAQEQVRGVADMTTSVSDGRADGRILRASATASSNVNGVRSITYCYHIKSFSWITNMHLIILDNGNIRPWKHYFIMTSSTFILKFSWHCTKCWKNFVKHILIHHEGVNALEELQMRTWNDRATCIKG